MAYTPKTWVCGESITDGGLNNMEEGIQEALDSALPEVTDADDGKILTVVDGEWKITDKDFVCDGDDVETSECFDKAVKSLLGYECEEDVQLLTNETITTASSGGDVVGNFTYSNFINADILDVTFDDVKYRCEKRVDGLEVSYGTDRAVGDWSGCPFCIVSAPSGNKLYVETAGSYTVKVESVEVTIDTSECFEKAVENVVGEKDYECKDIEGDTLVEASVTTTALPMDGASGTFPGETVINVQAGDTVLVTFNGVEHKCVVRADEDDPTVLFIGDRDADGFLIMCGSETPTLFTPTAGTFSVKISEADTLVQTSDCFCKAVNHCVDLGYKCVTAVSTVIDASVTTTASIVGAEGNFPNGTPFPFEEGQAVTVVLNGTEYEREVMEGDNGLYIGDIVIEGFQITQVSESVIRLSTSTAGTYNVQVKASMVTIDTSECFEKAVKKFVGFECADGYAKIFEENVTTVNQGGYSSAPLSYSEVISLENIVVTFDGTDYECELHTEGPYYIYGDQDRSFSDYPFALRSSGLGNELFAQTAGAHSLVVKKPELNVTTTPCFKKAVRSAVGESGPLILEAQVVRSGNEKYMVITNKTADEIKEAWNQGRPMFVFEDADGDERWCNVIRFRQDSDSAALDIVYYDIWNGTAQTSEPYMQQDFNIFATRYRLDPVSHFPPNMERYYGQYS